MRNIYGTLLYSLFLVLSFAGCSVDFSGFQALPSSGLLDGEGRVPGAFDFKRYNSTTGTDRASDVAVSVHSQSTGKILSLIVKEIENYFEVRLVRHLADGTLDSTFGQNGILNIFEPSDRFVAGTDRVAVLADDSIVYYRTAASVVRFKKFTSQGALDTSFGTAGRVSHSLAQADTFTHFLVRPDGRLLLVGETATHEVVVRQFTSSGLVDPSFGSGGRVVLDPTGHDDYVDAVLLDGAGKLLIAGKGVTDVTVLRLLTDGTLDASFGVGGVASISYVSTTSVLPKDLQRDAGGNIFVLQSLIPSGGGYVSRLTKLLDDGSVDASFGASGGVDIEASPGDLDFTEKLQLQADGKFLVAGTYQDAGGDTLYATRLNADGSADATYPAPSTYTVGPDRDKVRGSLLQADGKWIIMGSTELHSQVGHADLFLMRINTDGSLDATFNGTGLSVLDDVSGSLDYLAHSIVLSNGKILGAGKSVAGNVLTANLIRLLPTGELDTSFNGDGQVRRSFPGGTFAVSYSKVLELTGGKFLALGYYSDGATGEIILSRYLEDGTLDATFGTAGTVTYTHNIADPHLAMGVQADGKIIVVATLAADANTHVLRFNGDGTLDTSFGTSGDSTIDIIAGKTDVPMALKLLPNGQMLIVGFAPNGGLEGFLAKVHADGTLDTSFNVSGVIRLPNAELTALELHGTSKYFLGGRRGAGKYLIVAINSDGTFDDMFGGNGISEITTGPAAGYVSNLFVEANGKILANAYVPENAADKNITLFRTLATGAIDTSFATSGFYYAQFGEAKVNVGTYLLRDADRNYIATGFSLDGSYDFTFKYLNDL